MSITQWRWEPFVYWKKKNKIPIRQIEIKSNLVEKPIFFEEETKKPNEKQISKLKSPFRTDLNRNHPRGDKFFNKVLSFFKSLLEESPNEEELKKPIEEQHFAYKVKRLS